MLAIVGAILLGAAVFYIAYVTQISSATSQAEDRLGTDFGSTNSTFNPPLYIKLTKHLLKGSYLKLATGFWKPEKIARWKKTLISAGIGRNVEPEQFVASKFWLAVFCSPIRHHRRGFLRRSRWSRFSIQTSHSME